VVGKREERRNAGGRRRRRGERRERRASSGRRSSHYTVLFLKFFKSEDHTNGLIYPLLLRYPASGTAGS
jgi:hypothetical protein